MKQWLLRGLRLALAVVPLWWIADRVDPHDLFARLEDLHPLALVAAATAPFLAMAVAALRWRILMRGYGAKVVPTASVLLRHVLVGAYFNMLPAAVAGDALRAYRTRRVLGGTLDSLTVVFVERLCGLGGLLFLGVAALAAAGSRDVSLVQGALIAGSLCASLAIVAALFGPAAYAHFVPERPQKPLFAWFDDWIRRIPPPTLPAKLWEALGLSLLTQGITVLQASVLLGDLAPEAAPLRVLPLLPLVVFLTYFPITPAAIGQRELVFVKVLAGVGVAAEAALTVSLIVFASLTLAAGVGGVIYLLEGPSRQSTVPPAPARSWPPARPG